MEAAADRALSPGHAGGAAVVALHDTDHRGWRPLASGGERLLP